jgi:hypothetical protein
VEREYPARPGLPALMRWVVGCLDAPHPDTHTRAAASHGRCAPAKEGAGSSTWFLPSARPSSDPSFYELLELRAFARDSHLQGTQPTRDSSSTTHSSAAGDWGEVRRRGVRVECGRCLYLACTVLVFVCVCHSLHHHRHPICVQAMQPVFSSRAS